MAWIYPHQPIILAPLLTAILSANLIKRRGATFIVAMLASLCLAGVYIVEQRMPNASQTLWFVALWFTATLPNWFAKHSKFDIKELRNALRQAPAGLLITDLTGKIITANDTMANLFKQPPNDLIGQTLRELVDPYIWKLISQRSTDLASGRALDIEFDVETDSGTRAYLGHGKLATDSNGEPQYYVVQVTDLTREQAAERALNTASRQLKRILANSSDIVLVVNHKLTTTFANDAAIQILGSPTTELLGKPVYQLIKAADRRGFMRAMEGFGKENRKEISVDNLTLMGNKEISSKARIVRLSDSNMSDYAIICRMAHAELAAIERSKHSQARFSQVFHGSPDAILILRAQDNMIVDFNEGFTRLLGFEREDAIGESGIETLIWNSIIEREAVTARLRKDREVLDYETTLKSITGANVHVEISLRYVEIDSELCILCTGRDITKRISAEAALVETEEKFEKVFTESPDGMFIFRQSDGVITDLNEALVHRSGYTREDLIGHSVLVEHAFLDSEDMAATHAEFKAQGIVANRAVTFRTKQGKPVPSLISASELELSGESYLMVIAKDISKQRAIEERLRRSEERFRGIFENAPIGIMLVDMQGRIFQANRMAADILAYDERKLYGVHVSRLVSSKDRKGLKDSLSQLITSSTTTDKSERRLICQNDLEIWTTFHLVLQRNSKGDPLYYIVQIADISDIKRSQQRMEQMAFYDTLTKLANRRLFQERLVQTLEQTKRTGRNAALLYLDLDNFKRVNDTLGHQTGDQLLREVATRLQQCVRKEDTVARPGGDEFTILLNEVNTPSDAGIVAQKILTRLREPIHVSGHPLIVTTSIGITVIPSDSNDPNIIMTNADLAMYKAKERGRNNFQFYSEDLNANAIDRLRTEYEIRQALEHEEFELFYQPKISLKNHQIVGVESLVRWNHPQRGLLTPDQFIEIAEETGTIIDLGTWVIEESCRACRRLSEVQGRPVNVAINISPRQFRDPNLVRTVRRSLREMKLDPKNIELEITETMLMQDVAAAEATIRRLSDLGIKMAIDDFGTGYSSLNYLKRFPIDTVKVDKSFVMDLPDNKDDMAITMAVIGMAHQLNMEVVAEGVETREQLQFLTDQNCEYAQGFLFSKPLPMDSVIKLLEDNVSFIHRA